MGKDILNSITISNKNVAMLLLNTDGNLIEYNRKFRENLNLSTAECCNISLFDFDQTIQKKQWPDLLRELKESGFVSIKSLHRKKSGSILPVEMIMMHHSHEDHYTIAVQIKYFDNKQDIHKSLEIIQFIFEKAPLGIFLIKDGGEIVKVNEHASNYLGYTEQELCRLNVSEIDCGHSGDEIDEIWAQQRQKKTLDTFITVHRKKDGSEIPVEISGILFEIDNIAYSVSFVKDISERVEAEKQRKKYEEKIKNKQRLESLGTLAGGIAHDFNNILSAIFGYSELAQLKFGDNQMLSKYLLQISNASNRAKELVQQILLFSRQGHFEKGPIDISRIVNEALKLIKATLSSNIEIRREISPNLEPVFANEIHIHQIVMNLCTNACHAMQLKGGVLKVSLTEIIIQDEDIKSFPDLTPGNYLNMVIADTGCGIPSSMINKIFDPYFTTKATGEGTGLGLSTTHGIIKDHRGSIKVYSEVDVGTTFSIFLPSTKASIEPSELQGNQLPVGSGRILYVDDEKHLIDLGRELLERLGYEVETRASSTDGLQAFRANPAKYDLIISDITMPELNGIELARKMKEIRSDIPIILCSGFSERINEEEMDNIGISALLMKPVTYMDLALTVNKVIINNA